MRPIVNSTELPEGATFRFRVRLGGEEREAFLLRHQGQVRAWLNRCTHRRLPLDLGEGTFFDDAGSLRCLAHGATYGPLDGRCAGGPCPKGSGLTAVEVREEGGMIFVCGED